MTLHTKQSYFVQHFSKIFSLFHSHKLKPIFDLVYIILYIGLNKTIQRIVCPLFVLYRNYLSFVCPLQKLFVLYKNCLSWHVLLPFKFLMINSNTACIVSSFYINIWVKGKKSCVCVMFWHFSSDAERAKI